MTSFRTPLLALAFLVMTIAGWRLGESPAESSAPAPTPSGQTARIGRPTSDPREEMKKRLAPVRSARTPEERMRATIDLATTLPVSDFAAWLDGGWFSLREGMDLMLFTNILKKRWQEEDPEGFILRALERGNYDDSALREEWLESQPLRLIGLLKERKDDRTEIEILGDLAYFHPDLALQRFKEMLARGIAPHGTDYVHGLLEELAGRLPADLHALLDSLPEDVRLQAEGYLTVEKMRTSFSSTLQQLWNRPDGLELFEAIFEGRTFDDEARSLVSEKLVDELGNLPDSWRQSLAKNPSPYVNSDNMKKWLGTDLEGCGFDKEQALAIRLEAIERLAETDFGAALDEMTSHGISPYHRETIIRRQFGYLGQGDSQKYESLYALLATDEERNLARQTYEQNFTTSAIPTIDNPTDWLNAFESKTMHPNEYFLMTLDWDPGKLASLSHLFDSLPADKKLKLAGELDSGHSPLWGDALAYLIRQPSAPPQPEPAAPFSEDVDPFSEQQDFQPERTNGMTDAAKADRASSYVSSLAEEDPEGAGRWITSLPDGTPRQWAAKNLHTIWSQYDPAAADRWMKSLPASTRSKIESLGKK